MLSVTLGGNLPLQIIITISGLVALIASQKFHIESLQNYLIHVLPGAHCLFISQPGRDRLLNVSLAILHIPPDKLSASRLLKNCLAKKLQQVQKHKQTYTYKGHQTISCNVENICNCPVQVGMPCPRINHKLSRDKNLTNTSFLQFKSKLLKMVSFAAQLRRANRVDAEFPRTHVPCRFVGPHHARKVSIAIRIKLSDNSGLIAPSFAHRFQQDSVFILIFLIFDWRQLSFCLLCHSNIALPDNFSYLYPQKYQYIKKLTISGIQSPKLTRSINVSTQRKLIALHLFFLKVAHIKSMATLDK